ncbi:97881be1-9970-4ae1-a3f2-d37c75204eff [Sclerotinia trifoliorum]|uniref:97881be1-9970-4ae1-a3f2-d37c75204eff n=1 Tax=Sclerotinia trifoliorum TaxID=28548 RepID=A0A8H2VN21_9HELO|nr:97881be1-9970-4ae1-a3f2-d37c75204eff [Sclerotinia trifoliorum]
MADERQDVFEEVDAVELNEGIDISQYASAICDPNIEVTGGFFDGLASDMHMNVSGEDADAPGDHRDSDDALKDTEISKKELDFIAQLLKRNRSSVGYGGIPKKTRQNYRSGTKAYHPKSPAGLDKLLRRTTSQADYINIQPEEGHGWAVLNPQILPRMDTKNKEFVCPGLFLRLWDKASKSRIDDHDHGFLSASPDLPLRTVKERCEFFRDHTYWRHRGLTQGISITSHLSMLTSGHILPRFYDTRKKTEMICANLTLINDYAQIAAGIPILRVVDEIHHYDVVSLYGDQGLYGINFFENEYLVPYCVVPDAIIQTYKWRDIKSWMEKRKRSYTDWYKKFAVPAYLAHEEMRSGMLEGNPDMYVGVKSIFVDNKTVEELEALFTTPIQNPRAPRAVQRKPGSKDVDTSAPDDNLESNNK